MALQVLFTFLSGGGSQLWCSTAIAARTSASDLKVQAALRQQLEQSGLLRFWLPYSLHAAASMLNWYAQQVGVRAFERAGVLLTQQLTTWLATWPQGCERKGA